MTNMPVEFDLVSIGGGFAGLCAAVRGAELGLRTAVVEQGEAEPDLAAAIAEDCARTIDWLGEQGAQFASASPISWHRWTLAPPRAPAAGQDWQRRGPDLMIARLKERLEQRQGRMLLATRAT